MKLCAILAAMVIGGLTATASAGAPTGNEVVATYNNGMANLLSSIDDDLDVITATCIAKLAALDARGATDEQLTAFAGACLRKVQARLEKSGPKLRKLVTRTITSLGNLFEPDLVDQVTEVVETYDGVVSSVGVIFQETTDALEAALAAEIAD